ncbi:hypothetical protein FHG87_019724 [Trinorchestia longiramus]|nr:hypothetical protein FHG87_019724 [Trinorchestia longiramus]
MVEERVREMFKGSPHKDALDVAILSLQESGRLYIMKQLWWKEKHGGGKCKEEASAGGMASELNLSNVGGVFVVLIGGMGLALVVAIFEFLGECVNISKDDDIPLMDVLRQELRFVLKCKGSTKPIRKKSSDNGDEDDLDDEDDHEETIYGGSEVYTYGNKTPIT